jgi:DME family drug/metabolite transporter
LKALSTLTDDQARRGYLLVLAATLCWATSGTFIKIIRNDYDLSAWTLAFWRDLLTFAVFLAITAVLGLAKLRVTRRDLIPLAAMGAISIGIFHVLWNNAVTMIPVAVATVLNYTAPVFVVLFAWLLWHERPDRRQAAAVTVAFVGCVLVTGAYNIADMNLNWLGLLVGLSTGLTYGMFTIFGKNALRRYDSWTVLTYAFGFATATLLVMQPRAMLEMFAKPLSAWLWVIALVVVSTVAGFGLYTSGLKYLSASSASIAATLEPVIATGFAFALLGEVIEPVQMAGGILVIISVIILAVKKDAPTNLVSTP